MKPRILTILSAVTLFTALTIPIRLAAQGQSTPEKEKGPTSLQAHRRRYIRRSE